MNVSLGPDATEIIRKKRRDGNFVTAEEVVLAGLQMLVRQEHDFAPGELDALLTDGEESIEKEGTLDGEEAFAARRRRRVAR